MTFPSRTVRVRTPVPDESSSTGLLTIRLTLLPYGLRFSQNDRLTDARSPSYQTGSSQMQV